MIGGVVVMRAVFIILLGLLIQMSASNVGLASELVLYNWPIYLADEVKQQFTQESGYHIRELHYDSDDARNRLLLSAHPPYFDIVIADHLTLQNPQIQQRLLPLQNLVLPQVPTDLRNKCGNYAIPYMRGSLGYAYRQDKITLPLQTWHDLLSQAPSLSQHLVLIDDARALSAIALKALGYSINSQSRNELQQAFMLLKSTSPYVLTYRYSLSAISDPAVGDQVYAVVTYNGDFYAIQQHSPHHDWRFVSPAEGSLLWLDCLAIFKDSQQTEIATQFIQFVSRVEIANLNSERLGFNPILHEHLISNKIISNPIAYQDGEYTRKSEYYSDSVDGDRVRSIIYYSVLK